MEIGANISSFISVDCFLNSGSDVSPFYVKCFILLMSIPMVLGLPLLAKLPVYLYKRHHGKWTKQMTKDFKQWYVSAEVVLFFLFHPSSVSLALEMFACRKLGVQGTNDYLLADLSQPCWEPTHIRWLSSVGVMLLIMTVTIPVTAWAVLYRNIAKVKGDDARFKSIYGFVYNGYTRDQWYWEFVVLTRKVCPLCLHFLSSLFFSLVLREAAAL
jgi:hypothetical protein